MSEEANLARAMLELQRDGRTGILEVRGDGVRTVFYFDAGAPVAADHGTLGDTLGRLLLRQGLLAPAEYARALDLMVGETKKRFGEVVVEMGLLTAPEVKAALAAQLRMKVIHCLGWEWATWTFLADAERVKAVGHYPSRVEPLVLAAARLAEPWRLDEIMLPARGKYVLLRGFADAIATKFQMGALGQQLLSRLDGTLRCEQLLAAYDSSG